MGDENKPIATRVKQRDLTLFDKIPSQSVVGDREAWLQLQEALRSRSEGYVYLEIGSHLGGSIQNHLIDPQCRKIISIDKRPPRQPDDRGQVYEYENNSTERMLKNLREISETDVAKIDCLDSDAADVAPEQISQPPNLCFIDGEHTRKAALSDFRFCLSVCHPDGIIALHDDAIIWPALDDMRAELRSRGHDFQTIKLGGSTFAFLLGTAASRYPSLTTDPTSGDTFIKEQRSEARMEKWIRRPARILIPGFVRRMLKSLLGNS